MFSRSVRMYKHILTILLIITLSTSALAYDTGTQVNIPVANALFAAIDGAGETLALVSKDGPSLSIVSTKSGSITSRVHLAAPPSGLVIQEGYIIVSATSGQIYLFDYTGAITGMIDTDAPINSMARYGQQAVVITSGEKAYIVNISDGNKTETKDALGTSPQTYATEQWLVLTGNSDNGCTRITSINIRTGASSNSTIPGNVTSIAIDDGLGLAAATLSGKTSIHLFNVSTLESAGGIETERLIANISLNQSTHTAIMSSITDGSLLIVSLESKQVKKNFPLFDSISVTAIDASRNNAIAALSTSVAVVKLSNPVPELTAISPSTILAGSEGFPLNITGGGFIKDTQTYFNQREVSNLFGSNNRLTADILPDDLIYPGNVTVSAVNPAPGGGTSNPLTFQILTPIPQISEIIPSAVAENSPVVIRVKGKNFLPNAQVFVDGTPVEVYFVSSIALEAKLGGTLTGNVGTRTIAVVNTGPTTATSNAAGLAVMLAGDAKAATAKTQKIVTGKGSLTGQILNTNKKPVANVTVSYKGLVTKTDAQGYFTLDNIPEGRRTILMDGSTTDDKTGYYPTIPVTSVIVANAHNRLSFTPHLHRQKAHNFVPIKNGQETVVTDPEMKGFEMKIPKGTRIIGWDGKPNDKVSVRSVPSDRLPIRPLPANTNTRAVNMFFFDKVGGGRPDQPIPFKSSNTLGMLPGEKASLWYYDESSADEEAPNDWALAGTGTVSADGRFIVTDANVGIPKFCCGATAWSAAWSGSGSQQNTPAPNGNCNTPGGNSGTGTNGATPPQNSAADPVDVATGYFTREETDMVIPGIIPIKIKRYYISGSSGSAVTRTGGDGLGAFGKGVFFEYDWRVDTYSNMIRLSIPSGSRFDFALQPDGSYRSNINPEFIGGVITNAGGLQVLTTRDGWVYSFDYSGALVFLSDRNGNKLEVNRYPLSFGSTVLKIVSSEGKTVQFNLTNLGNYFNRIDSIISSDNRTVSYTYDTDPFSRYPRLKKVTRPDNSTLQYGYDATNGMMTTITDSAGTTLLTNVYDSNNRIIKQTLPDGGEYTFTYTLSGSVITQTDMAAPNGSVSSWRFNPYGYISEYATADGTTTYQMDSGSNHILSVTDPLNRTVSYTYYTTGDARNGLVSSITDPLGKTTSFDYEPLFGLQTKVTDPTGKSTTTAYTFDGKKVIKSVTRDPLNNATTVAYNQYGLPTTITDPNGNTTTLAYNPFIPSQMISLTDTLGNSSKYDYDSFGRIQTITDQVGSIRSFAYDNANRITGSTNDAGYSVLYRYDLGGNTKMHTDQKRNVTQYEYDNKDRLIKTTDRLGRSEAYRYYTGTGITATTGDNLSTYTDKKGQVTTFNRYDAMDRPTLVTFADGSTISATYDAAGLPKTITDSLSGTISFTYDAVGRIAQETTDNSTINYTYDDRGRRTSLTVAGDQPVTYSYDDAGRPAAINKVIGGVSRNYLFSFDPGGRMASRQIPLASGNLLATYGFDTADRLQSIKYTGAHGALETVGYTSNPDGNRSSMARGAPPVAAKPVSGASYNAEYEMLTSNGTSFTYDLNGNLVSKTDGTGDVTTYRWDARNRLVGITSPTITASFKYDAFNRRIAKTINGTTTSFLYDGADIIKEVTGGVVTSYIRTLGMDDPLSKITGSTVQHYLKDGLGSTIGLVDDNGNAISSIAYDAYGNSTSGESFGYTGRENDGTGLLYYRARYYSPEMRRFISRDPLGFAGGGVNFYGYVQNNPINWIDPDGLAVFDPGGNINRIPIGGGGGGGGNAPNFIVSPGGTAYPVPRGATGPTPVVNPAGTVTGSAFTCGKGGANGQVNTMRVMNPTPPRGTSPGYPDGYIKYENNLGQGVDPYSGRTLPNSQSHFPLY